MAEDQNLLKKKKNLSDQLILFQLSYEGARPLQGHIGTLHSACHLQVYLHFGFKAPCSPGPEFYSLGDQDASFVLRTMMWRIDQSHSRAKGPKILLSL